MRDKQLFANNEIAWGQQRFAVPVMQQMILLPARSVGSSQMLSPVCKYFGCSCFDLADNCCKVLLNLHPWHVALTSQPHLIIPSVLAYPFTQTADSGLLLPPLLLQRRSTLDSLLCLFDVHVDGEPHRKSCIDLKSQLSFTIQVSHIIPGLNFFFFVFGFCIFCMISSACSFGFGYL